MKKTRGIATLEMLIAMAIMILAIGASSQLSLGSQPGEISSQTNQEALYMAQQSIEGARATAKTNFDDPTLSVGTYTSTATSGIVYTKSLTVQSIDDATKQITSLITWAGQTLSLTTRVTDRNSNNSCSATVVNAASWKNPQHYDFTMDNMVPGRSNGNGDSISDVFVYHNKMYVTAIGTPNPNPETFFIFSLGSDPSVTPGYIGATTTNPSVSTGLSAVTAYGNYAYLMSGYAGSSAGCNQAANCAQLEIVDVSSPNSTLTNSPIKYMKIPAKTNNGALLPAGTAVFYNNGFVYVGLAKATTTVPYGEFTIIDVGGGSAGASPANPVLRGSYHIGNGVNSIYVKGNYAYVASPNSENVTVLDISNPSTPTPVGSGYSPSSLPESDGVGSDHGESLYVDNNQNLYLGRTYGTNEFYILNASTPSSLSVEGSKDVGSSNNTTISGLAVRSNLAFLLDNEQFQVWNISNPSNPTPWSADGTTNTFLSLSALGGNGSSAADCSGNYFYTAIQSSQGNNKDLISVITPGPIPQTLTLNGVPSSAIYSTSFPVSAVSDSGLAVAISTTGVCTGSGSGSATISMTSGTGSCSVKFSQAGNSDYAATTTTSVVAAAKATQATLNLSVTPLAPLTFGNTATLSSSGGSGTGTVTYPTSGGCAASGTTLSVTNATLSPCQVSASKAADTNYLVQTSSPTSITLQKASQIITFNALPDKTLGNPDFTITPAATSTSGLNPTYTSLTPLVCSIPALPGNTAHLVSTGICTLQASQSGSVNYNAAASVNSSFNVNVPFTYTVSNPGTQHVVKGTNLPITITATKLTGVITPVTLSISTLPANTSLVSTNPSNATCTPNPTCTVTFTFSTNAGASKSATSVVSGNPAPVSNQNFTFNQN